MLADLVLLLHAAFVLFVVGGLFAIWLGARYGRAWSRDPWFRGVHLAAIGLVAGQTALGQDCPLTLWEDRLRGRDTDIGFVARAVRAMLYWDAPAWVFALLYLGFFALVVWTWWRLPPRRRARPSDRSAPGPD
jgi:hypothetical protein